MGEEQESWGFEKRCGGLQQQLLKEGFLEDEAWEPCSTGGGGLSCGNLVPTENREGLRRGARIEHKGPSCGRVGLGALLEPPHLPPASCRPPCITSSPTASRSSSLAVGPGRLGRLPCGPVPTRPLPSLGPGPGSSAQRTRRWPVVPARGSTTDLLSPFLGVRGSSQDRQGLLPRGLARLHPGICGDCGPCAGSTWRVQAHSGLLAGFGSSVPHELLGEHHPCLHFAGGLTPFLAK